MRFYICADIEGVAGISSREQLRPEGGVEWARAREAFTAEVAAAAEALLAEGASEVVVSDSHGNAQNLLIEKLPTAVRLVRAWPRPLDMMQGIEDGPYAGALFLGHHAGGHETGGVCAHTYSSKSFVRVCVNGEPVSETRVNAALAAHFGVPTVFASGDDVYLAHVREILGDVETVETKRAVGTYSAVMRHPAVVRDDIQAAVKRAVGRLGDFRPRPIEGPVVQEVTFANRMPAEILAYLPDVTRVDSHTIRRTAADLPEAVRFLHFLQAYPQVMA
jgi:D-amino peptidase